MSTEVLATALADGAPYVAELVPAVRRKLPGLPPPASPDSEHARFFLFDATTRFLKKTAETKPLFLVVDDLHWADKPSLLLLEHLAREISDARIAVVGTFREAEAREVGPLADVLGGLVRQGHTLPLRGLGIAEVATFMQRSGAAKPDAALVGAVHRATDGNPFFIDEIVRLLVAEGITALTAGTLPIPEGVRAVIRRRLGLLPDESRRALAIGALVGAEFAASIVARAQDETPAKVAEALERARAAGLIDRVARDETRYRFAHALLRETLADDLKPSDRQRLHGAIAGALEEAYGAAVEAHAAELAHHFAAAGPGAAEAKAFDYSRRAGDAARAVHAYEEAAMHFRRALSLGGAGRLDELARCDLLGVLAHASLSAGEDAAGEKESLEALEIARRLRDPVRFAMLAMAFGRPVFSMLMRSNPTRIRLLEEALEGLDRESSLRATVMAQLAAETPFVEGGKRTLRLSEEALAMARRVGDRTALSRALLARCVALWTAPNPERLSVATEALRLCEESDAPAVVFVARRLRIMMLLAAGEMEAVDREIAACEQIAETLRLPALRSVALALHAMRAITKGRFEEAERLIRASIEMDHGSDQAQALARIQTFYLRWEQGRLRELVDTFGVERLFASPIAFRGAQAMACAFVGRDAEARRIFEELASSDFKGDEFALGLRLAAGTLSTTCYLLGDARRAAVLYESILPFAGEYSVHTAGLTVTNPPSHHLGLLATAMGRFEDAERHFEDAITKIAKLGSPPMFARNRYYYAEMLLRRGAPGDREKALTLLDQALETADAIGMLKIAADARALQAAMAASPAPARDRAEPAATGPDDTVTLMFSDMSGFTEMTERLGDAAALEVAEAHNAIIRREAAAQGGRELELQGDGFLLSFPAAKAALRSAIAIQRAFAAYSAEHPSRPIGVRIGIHTGEPLRQAGRYFGKAVILVTRIAAQAKSGEILVSSVVRDLGESAHEVAFDDGHEVELKGISGKRRIFRVRWNDEEPVADEPPAAPSVFRREGDTWHIACDGRTFRLKDVKGLRYLAELLHHPGREFAAIDLSGGAATDSGDAGPMLDAQAKAEYRRRLEDLREELEEAESFNDPARASRAREEIEALSDELSRATGLGGRDRKTGSAAERARLNVTMAIKSALKRIAENDATLGRRLAMTVKTGNFCSYNPDPGAPLVWS